MIWGVTNQTQKPTTETRATVTGLQINLPPLLKLQNLSLLKPVAQTNKLVYIV